MAKRDLDTATLDMAGRDYAREFLGATMFNPHNPKFAPIAGRGWVMNSLFNLHFKDEFDYLVDAIRKNLGPLPLKEFDAAAGATFKPRSDEIYRKLLAEHLAITPDGKPIPGKVGKVGIGQAIVGYRINKRGRPRPVKVEIRVGETADEVVARARKDLMVREIPLIKMALNTRISNECALLGANAIVDNLNEGSGAAVLQGRTGAQPADPDTATTGTNLFTLVYSDPAFGAATDANPGGRKTASAITSDSSADATGTLSYCRASSTNDSITPLDDHIDGEAGTSGADFNFNTLSIVSGATVSLSSHTITMPES